MAAVKSAVLKRSYSYESLEQINAEILSTQATITSLQAQLSGASAVRTSTSGYFSASTDGCEQQLTPAMLSELTPSKLDGLRAGTAVKGAGKIITGSTWYYAADVAADAARELSVGQQVTLRLSKGLEQDATAYVYSISAEEDGRMVVVLSCSQYISQVTLLRHQQGQILLREYTGLHIPSAALRMDEEGNLGVFCQVGAYVYRKPVTLSYRGEGFCLVRSAEGAQGKRILRQGDLVISTSQTLTDGMLLPDS